MAILRSLGSRWAEIFLAIRKPYYGLKRSVVQRFKILTSARMQRWNLTKKRYTVFRNCIKILGVDAFAKEQIDHYYQLSLEALDSVEVPAEKLAPLKEFAAWLYSRES